MLKALLICVLKLQWTSIDFHIIHLKSYQTFNGVQKTPQSNVTFIKNSPFLFVKLVTELVEFLVSQSGLRLKSFSGKVPLKITSFALIL